MPSGNKGGQGQGQNRQNGGVPRPDEDQGWKIAQQVREGAEGAGNRLHEGYDAAREGITHGYRRAEDAIARNPAPSVLLGFGLGFGLGLVLYQMFAHEEESWTERHITGPIRHMHVPESVKNVPEHVHHLADAIVSRLPHSVRKHLG